jgi:hypothetical protein
MPYLKQLLLQGPFTMAIAGALCGALIMEILARLGYLVVKTRAFGVGDTFIAAGLGAIFGFPIILIVLTYSILVQTILTLPVFVKKAFEQKEYLMVGTLCAFIAYAIGFGIITFKGTVDVASWIYIAIAAIFALLGLYLCYLILRSIRSAKESDLTYLPFGPAMVIAAFIAILF